MVPYFWNGRDGEQISTRVKILKLPDASNAAAAIAALNNSLFYWWFLVLSDCRHLNLREIENFPLGLAQMEQAAKQQLAHLTDELMGSFGITASAGKPVTKPQAGSSTMSLTRTVQAHRRQN